MAKKHYENIKINVILYFGYQIFLEAHMISLQKDICAIHIE